MYCNSLLRKTIDNCIIVFYLSMKCSLDSAEFRRCKRVLPSFDSNFLSQVTAQWKNDIQNEVQALRELAEQEDEEETKEENVGGSKTDILKLIKSEKAG